MLKNMGTLDRILRVIGGVALLTMAVFETNLRFSHLGWLGLIPLATALTGYCPVYTLMNIRTDR